MEKLCKKVGVQFQDGFCGMSGHTATGTLENEED